MKAGLERAGRTLAFAFAPDGEDPTETLAATNAMVELPEGLGAVDIHADLLALATALMIEPWTRRTLTLSWAVSVPFADAFGFLFGRKIGPVSATLTPRAHGEGVPGLCYSGGVDSTAALALMPEQTKLFFLERVTLPPRKTLYRKEAALHACRELASGGRQVFIVPTDFEWIRSPAGFPVDDISTAIPAVLLADACRLDSIGWGTIAEAAYRIGFMRYSDYATRPDVMRWRAIFEVVGLPYLSPMMGVSEVGSARIITRSPYRSLAQTCIRGARGEPCMRCNKCFRKSLIEGAHTGRWPSAADLDRFFESRAVRLYLQAAPITLELTLTYAVERYDGSHVLLRALRERLRANESEVDWLERSYAPALDMIRDKYRAAVAEALSGHLEPMTPRDEAQMRAVDMTALVEKPSYQEARERFARVLDDAV